MSLAQDILKRAKQFAPKPKPRKRHVTGPQPSATSKAVEYAMRACLADGGGDILVPWDSNIAEVREAQRQAVWHLSRKYGWKVKTRSLNHGLRVTIEGVDVDLL